MRVLTWLLAAMRSKGPYPILVLQGEAGSGKSQAAKMLRSLLDPSAVPFQPLPTNPNTLLRQATQTWIQAFDHITGMPKQISTALCRLSKIGPAVILETSSQCV
jgi:Mg-chelatase subunit ChlI